MAWLNVRDLPPAAWSGARQAVHTRTGRWPMTLLAHRRYRCLADGVHIRLGRLRGWAYGCRLWLL